MIGYTYSRQLGLARKGKLEVTQGRKVMHPGINQDGQTAESLSK